MSDPSRGSASDDEGHERTAQKWLEQALNAMPQIVWTCQPDGSADWINDRWREYTGSERDDESERWSFVHPDDRAAVDASWQRAREQRGVCELEYRLRQRDGRYRWHFARVVPIVEDGTLVRWIGTATDLDERKRMEQALRASEEHARLQADELATLMDAVPAGVFVAHDPSCRDVRGSRSAYEMMRVDDGENLSKGAHDARATAHVRILRDGVELSPSELPIQVAARTGLALRDLEQELSFADGTRTHVLGSAVPLRDVDGHTRGAIAAFVDITRLKLAEAALRDADRRKDEFLAVLSHELRNPLAPILTALELLKLRAGVTPEHELAIIERQARHMVRLVDDLLDVSRLARGKIVLARERLEIAVVVARALDLTSLLFEQRMHHLVVDVPAEGLAIEADEVRLTQVVSNLLTNAARYTPVGGHVTVTATREGAEVALRVRDDGVGIDRELLPHVFEMFVQGPRGPDRAEGGLGLGLALVTSLMQLHGGSVEASSDGAGRGATFVLRLPLAAAHARHADFGASEHDLQATANRSKILLVDDNEDAAETLSMLLARAGYEVQVAHDPPTALALAPIFAPDVAILDIGLPVMDGHQLARELQRLLGARTPTLIALSGYGQERDKQHSRDSGFVHHLTKPVSRATLLSVLARARPV